jgi:integrase
LEKNPLRKVELLTKEIVRKRRAFTDDEFSRMASVSRKHRIVYLLAAYTGLRRGELKSLQWEDLRTQDDKAWLAVRAATTKNRKDANLSLRQEILAELLGIRPEHFKPTDLMLKRCVPTMESFKKDLLTAGIEHSNEWGYLDFHSLRHTYATNLLKSGVTPRVAMEMMRHSDIKLWPSSFRGSGRGFQCCDKRQRDLRF